MPSAEAASILLVQEQPVAGEVAVNAARVAELIDAHPEADMIVFPELFLHGYLGGRTAAPLNAESRELVAVSEAAARRQTAVIVGFAEAGKEGRLNSAACFDTDGSLAAICRKIVLFGDEPAHFVAADRACVVRLAGMEIGVMICFDVEYPEIARRLADRGPDLLITISANMWPYFENHRLHARARALESRLPHLYVNLVGPDGDLRFIGGSCAIDPAGEVHGELPGERPGLLRTGIPAQAEPYPDQIDYPRLARKLRSRLTD